MRLRPERANHVWAYDFVSAMTRDGPMLRLLVLIDEYTRECLAIRVARRLGNSEVIQTLADVMVWRGIPEHIRSDNGPELVAKELRKWLGMIGTGTLYREIVTRQADASEQINLEITQPIRVANIGEFL